MARYSNPGYNGGGYGTNGRFSIFDNYVGLEARATTNGEIAKYLNEQLQPFQWDEMAWQKAIGALELDEAGKEALADTGINPHPWPIEAEQNPFAKAGPLGSIWPNPATGSGAYAQWAVMQGQVNQGVGNAVAVTPVNNVSANTVNQTPNVANVANDAVANVKNQISNVLANVTANMPSVASLTSNPLAVLAGIAIIGYLVTKK